MYKLVGVLVLIFCINAFTLASEQRIVNGTDAAQGDVPYVVAFRYVIFFYCGGSILNANYILTAAHCVHGIMNMSRLNIQYGLTTVTTDNTNSIPIGPVYKHPNFVNAMPFPNDIAVVKLQSPIPLGNNIQAVQLPLQDEAIPSGQWATVCGWGQLYSNGPTSATLKKTQLLVYTHQECVAIHNQTTASMHICAGIVGGGKGHCRGDSGGPLLIGSKQIGVINWSIKPCATTPGVYARVSSYVGWINEKMAL